MKTIQVVPGLDQLRIVQEGHFIQGKRHFNSKFHSIAAYNDLVVLSDLAVRLAELIKEKSIHLFLTLPSSGGLHLLLAREYAKINRRAQALVARRPEKFIGYGEIVKIFKEGQAVDTKQDEVWLKGPYEVEKKVAGRRVLLVEEVIHSGSPLLWLTKEVNKCGGLIIGVAGLINYGPAHPDELQVPEVFVLQNFKRESWDERICPRCQK